MSPSYATTTTPIVLDARDLMAKVTINVEIINCRRAAYRLWVGKQLVRLARLVMGCDISFQEQE